MRSRTLLPLCLTAALAAGCAGDRESPLEPPDRADRSRRPPIADAASSLDREWATLATSAIPGFAGHYLDDEGRSVVLLKNPAARAAAAAYALGVRRAMKLPERPVVFRQARYAFDELQRQHDRLAARLDGHGFVLFDIDEVENELFVGVEDEAGRTRARQAAAAIGVPAGMLRVEIVPRLEPRTNLTDRVRPAKGGVQINRPSAFSECTLGFNVYVDDKPAFITASHCSDSWFTSTPDGSVYRQPTAGSRIGQESIDAAMWTGTRLGQTCHRAIGCRLSDANLSFYDDSISNAVNGQGLIARTMSPGYGDPGSSTINSSKPSWRIEEPQPMSYMLVGRWVNKVGRTSGWTRGRITRSCFTVPRPQGDLLCHFESTIHSQGGDSGSPIFADNNAQYSNGQDWVFLYGILWGGPANDFDITIFGSLSGALSDLGISDAKFCVFGTPFNWPDGC